MPFRKFVEIGRVAYAVGGPATGKLVAIVDVIDYNRALIDGPCTGVQRQEYRFTNLRLTKYKIGIQHSQRTKFVTRAWKESKIDERWKASVWARVVEKRRKREALNDFDRFKVARLKYMRNKLIYKTYADIMSHRKTKNAKFLVRRKIKMEKDPAKKAKLIMARRKPARKPGIKNANVFRMLRQKGVLKKPTGKSKLEAKKKKAAIAKKPVKKGIKKTRDATKKSGDKAKKPDDKPKKPTDKKPAGDKAKKPATDKPKKPATDKAKKPATDKAKKPATDKAKKPATDKAKKPAPEKAKKPAEKKKAEGAAAKAKSPKKDK